MLLFALAVIFCHQLEAKTSSLFYQAEVGPIPAPRSLTVREKQAKRALVKAGYLKSLPETVQDSPTVKCRKITPKEVEALIAEIGTQLDLVPSPTTVVCLKAAPPDYPMEVSLARDDASALCYFEVLPDGSVNRIYGEKVSHEVFFIECARALKFWQFAATEKIRFFRFLFEAKFEG